MEFWTAFDIFHRLRPYLCSKREVLGFHKQATHGRPGDEPFFTLWSTVHDWGWPKNGPFWTKNCQTWQACQRSKVVQRGQNGQHKSFWTFGTLLGPSGPFWTISNKNWYFAPKHLCKTLFCPFGAKKSFLSEMVQKGPDGPKRGPKWSKRLRLTILVPFGPLWTTLERWQACHVWPFLVQNGPFLGHPQSWTVDPRVKKRLITTSPMCGLLVEPQVLRFGT